MQAMNIPILSSQLQELSSVSFGFTGTSEVNSFGSENEKTGSSFLEMLTSLKNITANDDRPVNQKIQSEENKTEQKTESLEKTENNSEKKTVDKTEKKSEEKNVARKEKQEVKKEKLDVKEEKTASENIELKSLLQNTQKSEDNSVKQIHKFVNAKNPSEYEELAEIQFEEFGTVSTVDQENILDRLKGDNFELKSKKALFEAQELSVEEPKLFLTTAAVFNENNAASEIDRKSISVIKKEDKKASKVIAKKAGFEERNKINVIDNRGSLSREEALKSAKDKMKLTVQTENENTVNMTLTMAENVEQNILSLNGQTAGAQGSNFQAMLSEQIQANAPEFVKAGNIVLQDNKTGSINLILKPENLGNVKVSLQLSDKVITGQIIVNSQEAYDAFKENLDTLKQAFQQNGFESPTFNLTFANNGGSFEGQNSSQQNFAQNFNTDRVYGDYVFAEETASAGTFEYRTDSSYAIDYIA